MFFIILLMPGSVDVWSIILLLILCYIEGNIRPCVLGTLIVSQLTYVKLNKIPNIDIYFRMPTICFPGSVVVFNGFCPSLCFDARWRTEEQEGVVSDWSTQASDWSNKITFFHSNMGLCAKERRGKNLVLTCARKKRDGVKSFPSLEF